MFSTPQIVNSIMVSCLHNIIKTSKFAYNAVSDCKIYDEFIIGLSCLGFYFLFNHVNEFINAH